MKLFSAVGDVASLGGDLRFRFVSEAGSGSTQLDATSIGLRAAAEIDLQRLPDPVPFIARLNLDYLFDNSDVVTAGTEAARLESLPDAAAEEINETRHLISRFERFALGVNRVDSFTLGVGIETPFELGEDLYLHPVLEWQLPMPINRAEYDCPYRGEEDDSGTVDNPDDSCLDQESVKAWPMSLAFGLRLIPPVRGLSAFAGVDLALGAKSKFTREYAPKAPFAILLALGYDYDAEPVEPPPPPPPPPAPPAPPPVGRIEGFVAIQGSGDPIGDARISFVDMPLTALSTGSDGHFVSYEFHPGDLVMEVSHPDYETGTCTSAIPATGGNVELTCTLVPLPDRGSLSGKLSDPWGSSIADARIQLNGPTSTNLQSRINGTFEQSELPAGSYLARIEADGYMIKLVKFALKPREMTTLDVTLAPLPERSQLILSQGRVRAPDISFAKDATDRDPRAARAVAELADRMLREPTLRIRIEGSGDETQALARALVVKQRLIEAGVSETRIEAAGTGGSKVKISVIP